MRRRNSAEASRNFESFIGGKAADAAQKRAEVLAIDVFHGEEEIPVDFADVIDAADVGMGDAAGDADLVAKSLERGGVAGDFGGKEFQGDTGCSRVRSSAG